MGKQHKVYEMLGLLSVMTITATTVRAGLNMDFRIIANDCDGVYALQADNQTDETITLQGPYLPDQLEYRLLHEPLGPKSWRRQFQAAANWSGNFTIPPSKMLERYFKRPSLMLYTPELVNAFSIWRWRYWVISPKPELNIVEPPTLCLGYIHAKGDELRPPYVEPGSGVSNQLAFVFHENRKRGRLIQNATPHELAFLLLNGTTEPLDAPPPLSAGSVLHLSAPGIDYSTNITLTIAVFEAKTIPSGECGQWRIPFERILAQIPKETVEAIRAADGKLDLVWKTGDIESQPLPLILLPPTQAELDAAFLAEHADVPRIDENTDLSFEFRLAGVDQNEPVLLGWLKNNEKHAVLANEKSYHNNSLDSSFRYAPFFTKRGQRSVLFLVEPNETALLSATLESLIHDIKDTLTKESIGRMFCYEWRCLRRFSQPIWFAIYGDAVDVSKIHTYADKYLPISEYHRPPLPPVAPLLAYIHNPETPPELTCVLWNRTEAAIQVTESRIIATNAALGYRRELALPAEHKFPVEVAPGAHTDWRVAWSAIIEQIPPADLARIKAADGKLDLGWQANNLASPPLPLLLGWQGSTE